MSSNSKYLALQLLRFSVTDCAYRVNSFEDELFFFPAAAIGNRLTFMEDMPRILNRRTPSVAGIGCECTGESGW
ncbi:hypothetical protein CEXT_767961 [Caerostris extrusa]|uniref:Uncharacterized protein n=1 Tax=Caerostris extrusa TaxID=172846 RepID=A0AAV4V9S9_CAEEX|nr:hypothetical protein CEXT_767961 [Caerostris extrusa]